MLNRPYGVLETEKIPIPRIALRLYKDFLYMAGTHKKVIDSVRYSLESGGLGDLYKNRAVYVPALKYILEHADEFAAIVAQMSPSLMHKSDIKRFQAETAIEITDVIENKSTRHPKSNRRSWFFFRFQ